MYSKGQVQLYNQRSLKGWKLPRRWLTIPVYLTIIIFQFMCVGCKSAWQQYDLEAESLEISRDVITTTDFNIAVYKNKFFNLDHRKLHVYLDGDGSPWIHGGISINNDPTPHQYLALELMSLDPTPSILIGRPCYHGFSQDINCNPLLWTYQRYSKKILSNISNVLNIILQDRKKSEVVLIGYSGGGTLAQMMAEKHSQIRAVITLAGNLDLNTWANLHRYNPLVGSINPIESPPLSNKIYQIHYVGRSDTNTPFFLAKSYVQKKGRGKVIILEKADHYNGWLEYWPSILMEIDKITN